MIFNKLRFFFIEDIPKTCLVIRFLLKMYQFFVSFSNILRIFIQKEFYLFIQNY